MDTRSLSGELCGLLCLGGAGTRIWADRVPANYRWTPRLLPLISIRTPCSPTGFVWPSMRVDEADLEGLAGIALTDHLEWQPHRDDIPNPDRNRSYNLAMAEAKNLAERTHRLPVIVIRGTEITRAVPPGHLNAVFLKDVNGLLEPNYPVASNAKDWDELLKDTWVAAAVYLRLL